MPFRSPYPDFAVADATLPEVIFSGLDEVADTIALVDLPTGRSYTYGQLRDAAYRVAAGLQKRGFSKGDKLALIGPNSPEYPIAVYGAQLAGGAVTTLNPLYTENEIEHQLHDAQARFLIASTDLLAKALPAAHKAHIERVFTFGASDAGESFETLMQTEAAFQPVSIDPANDTAAMLYSSGTTGLPKGVVLTHRNLVAALTQCEGLFGTGPKRALLVLPIFHIFGFHAITNFDLSRRGTIVMMPRFDMEKFLETIQQRRIQRICIVPPIVLGLVKSPLVDKYDLSSLELIFSGAAPLDLELAAACEKRIGCRVRQGYGMTETGPPICGHPLDSDKCKHGSVGVLVPNTEAMLIDATTGEEAKPGEPGELWVRGPQVMKGYYNNPDSTRDTLLDGGWLRTGDIAKPDEDGWLFIVDRAKELIKFKGLQVAPAELEAVLVTHPQIADAAVIGIPDEEAGEIPKAFVVIRGDLTPDQVLAYVAERVAPYKKIRRIEFLDAIPKSPSGKILRRVLKDRERAAAQA
jgi:acyl-CoA synthetase (AMP-forming)/AMP-acid ligase II